MPAPRRIALALATAATACGAPPIPPMPAAPAAESGAYVLVLGDDTVAVDRYTRTADRIEGELLTRAPRTAVLRYTIGLTSTGTAQWMEQRLRLPNGEPVPGAPRSVLVTYTADSVVSRVQRDTMITIRAAAAHAYPFINFAVSLYALPIAALNASGADSMTFVTYVAGARQPQSLPVARKGANRYWVYVFGSPHDVTTDASGRIVMVDARRSTLKVLARRQDAVDVAELATRFAEREAATRPSGPLSTRDTVNATVGAAQIWIDYGRPSARGRRVFSDDGVLGDTLWRTGANAATQFRTSVPLVVAGQAVPAGTYTLWTHARNGRYQLIINRQTGQWGTQYDAAQDHARVPLQMTRLAAPVERFTIAVDPATGSASVLRLRWADTELSVPIAVP